LIRGAAGKTNVIRHKGRGVVDQRVETQGVDGPDLRKGVEV
jgi:hypothetical protein